MRGDRPRRAVRARQRRDPTEDGCTVVTGPTTVESPGLYSPKLKDGAFGDVLDSAGNQL